MPKKTFYLDANKQEKLKIKWGLRWQCLGLQLNGRELHPLDSSKNFKEGVTVRLDNQRELKIKMNKSIMPHLDIMINGAHVEGSPGDPSKQIKTAYQIALFLGFLNITLGLIAEWLGYRFLLSAGMGYGIVFTGIIVIILAFGIRSESKVALIGMMLLLVSDIVLIVWYTASYGGGNLTSGITLKVIFLLYFYKAYQAAKRL